MTLEAMIDIETLDTEPGSVVLSIGAVLFTQARGVRTDVDSFYRRLELDEQIRSSRTISQASLLWWMEQDAPICAEAFHRARVGVSPSLLGLTGYLRHTDVFWANGPAFDLIILESLYKDNDMAPPWKYSQGRDMRTLREAAGMPRDWDPGAVKSPHGPHHPVHDCLIQVEVVREARRRIAFGEA
jgi:hypothetical protein